MAHRSEDLARRLRAADRFEQTRLVTEYATDADVRHRRAIAEALATGAGDLGVVTAIDFLARDADEDVRAAAVQAAAVRLELAPTPYGRVVRAACADESRRVRTVALSAARKAIETGRVRGLAPALVRCIGIDDSITQELALEVLAELAPVKPRRVVDAYAQIIDGSPILPVRVKRVLAANLEALRDAHPRRVARLLARLHGDGGEALEPCD